MQRQISYAIVFLLVLAAVLAPAADASYLKKRSKISCDNYHPKCHKATEACKHKTYKLMMVHLCANTCNFCQEHIALKAQCQDKLTNCKEKMCHESDYKEMMYKLCRKTCKRC